MLQCEITPHKTGTLGNGCLLKKYIAVIIAIAIWTPQTYQLLV